MTDHPPAGPSGEYRPEYHPQYAHKLAKMGVNEEGLAAFFEISVYTVYQWEGLYPEFAQALIRGRTEALEAERLRPPARSKYPAYTWALQFCHRTKRPELAALLKAKMAEMKAIGPKAAAEFNDLLYDDVMLKQPLRRIPRRP